MRLASRSECVTHWGRHSLHRSCFPSRSWWTGWSLHHSGFLIETTCHNNSDITMWKVYLSVHKTILTYFHGTKIYIIPSYLVLAALTWLQTGKYLALNGLHPEFSFLKRGSLKVPHLTRQGHNDELKGLFLLWNTPNVRWVIQRFLCKWFEGPQWKQKSWHNFNTQLSEHIWCLIYNY